MLGNSGTLSKKPLGLCRDPALEHEIGLLCCDDGCSSLGIFVLINARPNFTPEDKMNDRHTNLIVENF